MRTLTLTLLLILSSALIKGQDVMTDSVPLHPSPATSAVVQTITREYRLPVPLNEPNLTQFFQGRAAGVIATSTSGRPGDPASLLIWGKNTIDGNSEPYYLVNGLPMAAAQLSAINVYDIETVVVLKDAITTSAYGVNGANGVVVITTKAGRHGPPKVWLSAEAGFSNVLKHSFDLMNTKQKLDYELGLGIIDGATYNKRLPHQYNHMDEFYRTAWTQRYDVQVSGGSERITYYLSGGSFKQDGILHSSSFKRYTLNVDVQASLAKWIKVGSNIYVGKENNVYPLTNESGSINGFNNQAFAAFALNPYEQLKNIDGTFIEDPETAPLNPLLVASNFSSKDNFFNLGAKLFANITFSSKFKLVSSLYISDKNIGLPQNQQSFGYFAKFYRNRKTENTSTSIQTNKLSFNTYLDGGSKHELKLDLSSEIMHEYADYSNTSTTFDQHQFTQYQFLEGSLSHKRLSGMLQASYAYNSKVFANALIRIDNSRSSMWVDEATKPFWAFGLGWNAINKSGAFNRLTVKGSAGTSSKFYSPYSSSKYYNNSAAFPETTSIHAPNLSGIDGLTSTYDLGVDAGFFDDRLQLSLQGYLKNATDLMAVQAISVSPGFITEFAENSKLQNKGFELTANYSNSLNRYTYFSIGATMSINNNKLAIATL